MKKTLRITAVAAFMLLAAYGTVEAWPRSGGGITGIHRSGRWRHAVHR